MPFPGAVTALDFYGDGTVEVTATSIIPPHTSRTLTLLFDVASWEAWKTGASVQWCFPFLSPNQREFLLSGMTDEEWDAHCSDEDTR